MKIAIIADNLGNNAPGLVFRNILTGLSKKIEFDIITSTLDYRAPKEHRGSVNYVPQKRIPSWRLRTFLFNIFVRKLNSESLSLFKLITLLSPSPMRNAVFASKIRVS